MCGKLVPMAVAARRAEVPVLIRLQNVSFWDLGGSLRDLGNVPVSYTHLDVYKRQEKYCGRRLCRE